MKKILSLLILATIAFACNKDDNNSSNGAIVGQWRLSQILVDPGDGSGTFQPVDSEKILIFREDSKVISSGTLCYITTESDIVMQSTYSASNKTITSDCSGAPTTITYDIVDGELILYYQCIEACQAKYTFVPQEVIID